MNDKVIEFGVANYYGGLCVKESDGKYFWSVENYDGHHWEEIPKYLSDALKRYHDEGSQS